VPYINVATGKCGVSHRVILVSNNSRTGITNIAI
jgi:hypothetical protein